MPGDPESFTDKEKVLISQYPGVVIFAVVALEFIRCGFRDMIGKVEGLSKRKLNMEDTSQKWTRVLWCIYSGLGQAKRKS